MGSTTFEATFRFPCRGGDSCNEGMVEYVTLLDDAEELFLCLPLGLLFLAGIGAGNSTGSVGSWKVGDGVLNSLAMFAFWD